MYVIICDYYVGSKAKLTFQFGFWCITERRFGKKYKQDAYHRSDK
jgi:hypothetical protein